MSTVRYLVIIFFVMAQGSLAYGQADAIGRARVTFEHGRRTIQSARNALDAGKPAAGLEFLLEFAKESEGQSAVEKDWGKSDELRDELQAAGFEVRDTKLGTQVVPRG